MPDLQKLANLSEATLKFVKACMSKLPPENLALITPDLIELGKSMGVPIEEEHEKSLRGSAAQVLASKV
jgi:hypothetical protein